MNWLIDLEMNFTRIDWRSRCWLDCKKKKTCRNKFDVFISKFLYSIFVGVFSINILWIILFYNQAVFTNSYYM